MAGSQADRLRTALKCFLNFFNFYPANEFFNENSLRVVLKIGIDAVVLATYWSNLSSRFIFGFVLEYLVTREAALR